MLTDYKLLLEHYGTIINYIDLFDKITMKIADTNNYIADLSE